MTDATLPRIAFLLGDPTGIGPEIVAKVLHDGHMADIARLVVVGDARVFEQGMKDAGVTIDYERVTADTLDQASPSKVPLIDLGNMDPATVTRGSASADAGRMTGDTLVQALRLARQGLFDAVTFAPLNKRAMFDGGYKFADEHQLFAHELGHNGYFSEMNVLDGQWMSRVTGHQSLRAALDNVTPERITDAIQLADTMMRRAGIEQPRIAVAALNPHGGENGLFGTEEIDFIRPTVERVAATGIDCRGPFPADTVYLKAFNGDYDSVVSMYHDQGQIATKLRGFNRGVTITAGLSTVLTTPSHGTAYDIVGQGVATTGALESAIRLAAQLSTRQIRQAA
jgi:4-hydroxythreonine-4-phosphate dehydrogenase